MWWWGSNIALMIVGTLIGVLLCEVGLRAAGVSYPIFSRIDHDLGASLRPDTEGWNTKEGQAYIRINSAGFRIGNISLSSRLIPYGLRCLGTSYAEAQ